MGVGLLSAARLLYEEWANDCRWMVPSQQTLELFLRVGLHIYVHDVALFDNTVQAPSADLGIHFANKHDDERDRAERAMHLVG